MEFLFIYGIHFLTLSLANQVILTFVSEFLFLNEYKIKVFKHKYFFPLKKCVEVYLKENKAIFVVFCSYFMLIVNTIERSLQLME